MARNGSGTMSVPNPDFVSGTTISSDQVDANFADVVTELTNSIAADGQTTATALIPFAMGINTDTIAENGSGNGVTVDSMLIKDGGIVGDLTLTSTDAGATGEPDLILDRDSASPAASDVLGRVIFRGEDDAGNDQDYAMIQSVLVDPVNTSEDGALVFQTAIAGTLTTGLHLQGAQLLLGDTTNANNLGGLTINQGAADDEVFSLKSSDVAHGMTSVTETDTYFFITKQVAAEGGAIVRGLNDNSISALRMHGTCASDNSTKTTSGRAPVEVVSSLKNTTTVQDNAANANLFAVLTASAVCNFIVDQEGELFANGGTSSTNMVTLFDAYDDAALVQNFNHFLGAGKEAPDFERMKALADLKLLGHVTPEAWARGERPMWSVTKLAQLHNGWMVQAHAREALLWSMLDKMMPGFLAQANSLAKGLNVGRLPA